MRFAICDPGAQTSHKLHRYICSNIQKYIVWVKIINFSLCQKSLGYYVKIMFHEEYLVISFRKYFQTYYVWLVICIAKNFIWTTLKAIFTTFRFLCILNSRFSNSCISDKYCPILTTIHQWKAYLFCYYEYSIVKSQIRICVFSHRIHRIWICF